MTYTKYGPWPPSAQVNDQTLFTAFDTGIFEAHESADRWRKSVRVASTANINLATGGLLTVDGITLVAGNRVLVKNQTAGAENGYYVAASGAWSRATDADASAKITPTMATRVEEGTQAGQVWYLSTTGTITLGTTTLTFAREPLTAATDTAVGGVELATSAETITGTDATRATTPAGVKAAIDARYQYVILPFAFKGNLTTTTDSDALPVPVPVTGTIMKAFARVRQAPTTQAILIDFHLNGTTIHSGGTGRLSIAAAGTNATTTTFSTTSVTEGTDYVTCNIDQVGSGTVGADLVVILKIRHAI